MLSKKSYLLCLTAKKHHLDSIAYEKRDYYHRKLTFLRGSIAC